MAYDERLADRVRAALVAETGAAEELTEKKMFGGLGFMLDDAMAVAVSNRGGLLLRTDPADLPDLLAEPGAGPFEMRGRVLSGWLRVEASAVDQDDALRRWVRVGAEAARSQPR